MNAVLRRCAAVHRAVFNGNGLARQLLLGLVVFSSLITALITSLELYAGYRRDMQAIDAGLSFIESSYLPTLAHGVWEYDGVSVQRQLEGMLRLPDIEFAGIEVDGRSRWSAGTPASQRQRQAQLPLWHELHGEPVRIGSLRVVAGVDAVVARLWEQLLARLLANAVKTLLVAGFVMVMFQVLVTRHLAHLASFVHGIDPLKVGPEQVVQLDRPARGRWRPDMLDKLAGAINGLMRSLREEHAQTMANEARLRALTEHCSALIYELDVLGRVSFANREAERVVGTLALDWIPEEHKAAFASRLSEAWAGARPRPLALHLQHRNGEARSYLMTITPVRVGDAAVRSVALTALDVTELQRAELAVREANRELESRVRERTAQLEAARDEAENANRAKSEFLSRMSHELRTPMNAILGFAQILQMSRPSAQQARWACEIRRAGDHLLELIDDLLDLARIEVGKLRLQVVALDLGGLVDEAAAIFQPALAERRVVLSSNVNDPTWVVMADRTRLRQIVVNLLSNAIKYNREGGRVELRTQRLDDQRVRLSVSDNGCGIAAEQLGRVFSPYERLGREGGSIEGTGIGLALSKRLAEMMDCALGVRSREGSGSTFWIDLPLAVTARTDPVSSATMMLPAIGERRLRVLYIEDDTASISLMHTIFAEYPTLELTSATDGAAGLRMARQQRPDLILLDVRLPAMDGYAVLAALEREPLTRGIPVIAVTAHAMALDLTRGAASRWRAYVTKPIVVGDLMEAIGEVAGQPA
jgi:PAS domain S-box-containing protein